MTCTVISLSAARLQRRLPAPRVVADNPMQTLARLHVEMLTFTPRLIGGLYRAWGLL